MEMLKFCSQYYLDIQGNFMLHTIVSEVHFLDVISFFTLFTHWIRVLCTYLDCWSCYMVKIFQPGWRQFDLAIVQMFVLMLAHTHFSANLWSIHFLMCKYFRKFFYPKLIRHLVFLHSIFTDNFGHFWWLIPISIWTSWNVLEFALNQEWFCLKPIIVKVAKFLYFQNYH